MYIDVLTLSFLNLSITKNTTKDTIIDATDGIKISIGIIPKSAPSSFKTFAISIMINTFKIVLLIKIPKHIIYFIGSEG
ncbi:hypothetical protein [Chryseobacterium sp.]|uniref:hypothetical protein n=1 Tax=Chryseobacterium sp. TaxID=1871047 RepID=UPI00262E2DB9|nr:hypothetical protein [Chryseobacterium sp.]